MNRIDRNSNIQQQKQEVQCNCFTYTPPERDYFLTNNRKHHRIRQTNNQHAEKSTDSQGLPKNKRSLRKVKQVGILSPQPKKERDVYREYYSPGKISGKDCGKVNLLGQVREIEYKAPVPKVSFNKVEGYLSSRDKIYGNQQIWSRRQNRGLVFEENKPRAIYFSPQPQNTPTRHMTPKISFNLQASQPFRPPFSAQLRKFYARGIKDEHQTEPQTCQKIQTQPEIDLSIERHFSKQTRIVKSRTKEDQSEQGEETSQNKFNIKSTSESIVNKNSLIVPATKLSGFGKQISKSKIGLKKIKEGKPKLKKMSDVEQIRSMVDSEEQSSDDKESVVLGRLRQYGSISGGSQSFIPMTIESKLGYESRLGYQSTNAGGRSHLRNFESVFR